ncbi:TEX30-like protein [Mya arenaria]|uniref:TEX30-like protein n=1 Tax=Mya arenaria TaxID=6604 RepID=A0ABY7ER71_MYAAR|nr:TEX30-like protein [Mya arenaria]
MELPQLSSLASLLAEHGFTVVRFTCKGLNLGYRIKVYSTVLEHCKDEFGEVARWLIGGRSMGARAALGVANSIRGTPLADSVIGAICISYPLHTKDNYSDLRDGPLFELETPVCFISGSCDEMCDKSMLESVLKKMKGSVLIKWIDGADHGLKISRGRNSASSSGTSDHSLNNLI